MVFLVLGVVQIGMPSYVGGITGIGKELVNQTFFNQALNTLDSFGGKGFTALDKSWFVRVPSYRFNQSTVKVIDARSVEWIAEIRITDPPYADTINYHELSEFFLA